MTGYMQSGTTRLLIQPGVADALTPRITLGPSIATGFECHLEETKGVRVFWLSGFNDGFHSFAFGDPEGCLSRVSQQGVSAKD